MKNPQDDRTVSMDKAMAMGQMAYPVEIGKWYYVTTTRFDSRGRVVAYGPLGILMEDTERIFDSGPLKTFWTGPAQESEPMPNRHFVNWMHIAEMTEVDPVVQKDEAK